MLPGVGVGSEEPPELPRRPDLPAASLTDDGLRRYPRPNGEDYLTRALGDLPDIAVLRRLRTHQLYAVLIGDPGVGKTALLEAAFPDLLTVQCSGDMTVPHLVGSHLPTPSGGWRWHDGPLVTAMRTGGVLYLDELNVMPLEVSTVLHSAMDGRGTVRIDDLPGEPQVTAAPGFFVVAAYNPGRVRARHPSEALRSRFAVQLEARSDFDTARALGIQEEFVVVAENLAVRDTGDRASGGVGVWGPQLRELLIAQRLIDAGLGAEFAAGAMVGQCPVPEDLPEVCEVASNVLGLAVAPLVLGRQLVSDPSTDL